MSTLISILAATLLVSVVSLSGAFFLLLREDSLKNLSALLVAFASGSLMGGAFFHLIPEAVLRQGDAAFGFVVLGIVFFFALEKILCWRHCHNAQCDVHSFTYLNLVGDSIHNFVDGIIIAASFLVDPALGLVTTAVVILHEVPQELGEFGVLIYGGFSRSRAIWFNLLTALTALAGGAVGYFFSLYVKDLQVPLISFAAGGFVYIALADLVPELHKRRRPTESAAQFSLMLAGLGLLGAARFVVHHHA